MSWTEITRAQYRRDDLICASDVNDAEWLILSFFLPPASHVGRPREVALEIDVLVPIIGLRSDA